VSDTSKSAAQDVVSQYINDFHGDGKEVEHYKATVEAVKQDIESRVDHLEQILVRPSPEGEDLATVVKALRQEVALVSDTSKSAAQDVVSQYINDFHGDGKEVQRRGVSDTAVKEMETRLERIEAEVEALGTRQLGAVTPDVVAALHNEVALASEISRTAALDASVAKASISEMRRTSSLDVDEAMSGSNMMSRKLEELNREVELSKMISDSTRDVTPEDLRPPSVRSVGPSPRSVRFKDVTPAAEAVAQRLVEKLRQDIALDVDLLRRDVLVTQNDIASLSDKVKAAPPESGTLRGVVAGTGDELGEDGAHQRLLSRIEELCERIQAVSSIVLSFAGQEHTM